MRGNEAPAGESAWARSSPGVSRSACPVLLGVATLVFSLIHMIPGDPAQAMLGEAASPADVAALRSEAGARPAAPRTVRRVPGGLARGDLGTSLRTGEPVAQQIWQRVPATVELAAAAMVFAIGLALAARRARRRAPRHGGGLRVDGGWR